MVSRAAARGLADSQFNLGILAEHGLGRPKDLAEAYRWFALAAQNGDKEAAKRAGLLKAKLEPQTLATAEEAVKAWTAQDAAPSANEVVEKTEWAVSAAAPIKRDQPAPSRTS
jgi:localization factor PodJL